MAAIEQSADPYHPTITRFAQKFCATPEDVEDARTGNAVDPAQKIGTLRVTSAFVSWPVSVVRRPVLSTIDISATSIP